MGNGGSCISYTHVYWCGIISFSSKSYLFIIPSIHQDLRGHGLLWVNALIPHDLTNLNIYTSGDAVTREIGFVAPVAADWTLSDAAFPLSLVFIVLGASAAVLGPWQNKVGPRKALMYASCSFGGGLMLGAAGIHYHMLPLLYLGYGVMGGTGLGLAYTPPIQTLMQWFPDKRGTASGLAIAGFGSGALVFTPAAQALMKYFSKMPEYVGPTKDFALQNIDGKMFTEVNGNLVEVVEALSSDIAKLPYDLAEGLYVVGSGATGGTSTYLFLIIPNKRHFTTPILNHSGRNSCGARCRILQHHHGVRFGHQEAPRIFRPCRIRP